jgi:DNA-binding transcriptional LysR family regulator
MERLRKEAPNAAFEWTTGHPNRLLPIAEGQIDVALLPTSVAIGTEFDSAEVPRFRWASFVRRGHPAVRNWGRAAWSRYPHVVVRIGEGIVSPVESAITQSRDRRRVGVWVPYFAAVAPLLAASDLIATLPMVVMADRVERYGLHALRVPIPMPPMAHRLIWSRRLAKDPASRWLREHVLDVISRLVEEAERLVPQQSAALHSSG